MPLNHLGDQSLVIFFPQKFADLIMTVVWNIPIKTDTIFLKIIIGLLVANC